MELILKAKAAAEASGKRMSYILYHIRLDWERRDFKDYDRDINIILKYCQPTEN